MQNSYKNIDELFVSNLGATFEPIGATTWEQFQSKRERKRTSSMTKKIIVIVATSLISVAAAAWFVGPVFTNIFEGAAEQPSITVEHTTPKSSHPVKSTPAIIEAIDESKLEEPVLEINEEKLEPITEINAQNNTTVKPIFSAKPNKKQVNNFENIDTKINNTVSPFNSNTAVETVKENTASAQDEKTTLKVVKVYKNQVLLEDSVVTKVKQRVRNRN
ncbi:MAG: hypothetical protein IPO21_08225 [Bacteroidales bacterium]|nr:hypothetical protein [Bacteroidales bacterium]